MYHQQLANRLSRTETVETERMVSARSLEWMSLLIQLVLSGVCLIASLAVISAKLQSISSYPDKQFISFEWWTFCVMSFMMIFATVFSMIGLTTHRRTMLYPHLMLLIFYSVFVGKVLIRVVRQFEISETSWGIGVGVLICAEYDVMEESNIDIDFLTGPAPAPVSSVSRFNNPREASSLESPAVIRRM